MTAEWEKSSAAGGSTGRATVKALHKNHDGLDRKPGNATIEVSSALDPHLFV